MAFSYKTSPSDAAAMAAVWYGLAGVSNPSPQAIQWWTKQIQQDGSQPAFDNFKNGKGQDAQSKFDPNVLAQNAGTFVAGDTTNPATNLTGDPQGTFAPAGAASNGANRLVIAMHLIGTQCGVAATAANLLGVTPA